MTGAHSGEGEGGSAFLPKKLLAIDLAEPLPTGDFFESRGIGDQYGALLLVRIRNRAIGMLRIDPGQRPATADDLGVLIWSELADAINAELVRSTGKTIDRLGAAGLIDAPAPEPLAIQPKVTVLVATRDRTETLDPCLRSLLALDYPHVDIVVVDSAPSTEATADLIASDYAEKAPVRYVREEAPGLAIAHNAGLEHISSPIIAITDDDVVVDPGWLTEIVRQFNRSPDIGCVTGLILPMELETPAQDLIEQFGGFARGYDIRHFSPKETTSQGPLFPYTAGAFGSGANMAFRRSALLEVGGFDPALGAGTAAKGGDDLAAFFAIIAGGHDLAYTPDAVLWHRHRRDYAGMKGQAFGYGVGLGAYLTSIVARQPWRLFDMLWRMPGALHHLIADSSPKNRNKQADYPAELTRLERKGLIRSPFCYALSRWKTRHVSQRQRRALKQQRVAHVALS